MAPSRLVVARYAAVDPARMVPVQTSVGRPKLVSYELISWGTVAPWGLFKAGLDEVEFERRYTARLDQRAGRILAELSTMLDAYDPFALALCCFEDVRKPGFWCHRTILSGWLEERLGVAVPDLEEVAASRNPSM